MQRQPDQRDGTRGPTGAAIGIKVVNRDTERDDQIVDDAVDLVLEARADGAFAVEAVADRNLIVG